MIRNLLLALMLFGMGFAGLAITDYTTSQESYLPGSSGYVTITLSNPLSSQTTVNSLEGVNIEVTSSPEILVSGETFVGDIEPGGSSSITFPFQVKTTAKSSIYLVKLKATGISDRPGDQTGFDSFTRRVTIPVTVIQDPLFSIKSDKQVISGVDEVSLTITNNGGSAKNVRISIPEKYNMSFSNSGSVVSAIPTTALVEFYDTDELYIGRLDNTTTIKVHLDSRNAENGLYDIPFQIDYEDELGMSGSTENLLRFTVRDERLDVTFTQKTELNTRDESVLTLEVKNNGDKLLEDVRLVFINDSVRMKNASEFNFGDLNPGSSSTVSVLIYTELEPGVNLLPARLEWIESEVQNEEERDVAITVTSDADVAVYLEAKPLPLRVGNEHTVSVLVSNLGSFQIENVDVTISSPALSSLDISNNQYIGGLQRDDFSTVQFLMKPNMSGNQPVYLKINYRDQSGEWKSETITQYISIYEPDMQDADPLPLLLLAIVVVILVWWFKFRNKK